MAMAIWRNNIQRIKIVINDNIIELVTEIKYYVWVSVHHKLIYIKEPT